MQEKPDRTLGRVFRSERFGSLRWRASALVVRCVGLASLILTLMMACSSSDSVEPTILATVECVRPDSLSSSQALDYFDDFIAGYEDSDRENSRPPQTVVLVGSSSILFWGSVADDLDPIPVTSRGFGGSIIQQSTHYADRIIFPYDPMAVVLYAGDNDIGSGFSADCVFRDFEAFAERIHEERPDLPLYYIAIKPSILRWQLYDEVERANNLIAARAQTDDRITFVDIATPMLGEDGTPREELFVADGLHLSATGYELWTSVLKPVLLEDLGISPS